MGKEQAYSCTGTQPCINPTTNEKTGEERGGSIISRSSQVNNLVVIKVARQRFLYLLCALRKSQNRLVDGGGVGGAPIVQAERERACQVWCACAVQCIVGVR